MEPARKHMDSLPSMSEFERHKRERDEQFSQGYPMPPRHSVSTTGPGSPPTYSPSTSFPSLSSGTTYKMTPPISRRSSGHEESRDGPQSRNLPSLHEVFESKSSPFPAPSPIHTPPIGSGSFPGSVHHNPLPRSQPLEPNPRPSIYPPPPPPSAPSSVPAPAEPFYPPNTGRSLPPNPYSSHQPPPIPPMQPPPQSYPAPPSLDKRSRSPPPPIRSSQYPSISHRPGSPSRYQPAPPHFNGSAPAPLPPQHPSHQSQYPSYSPSQQSPSQPPPNAYSHPPPAHPSSVFAYPPPPAEYRGPSHEPGYTPGAPPPSKGIKRASGYANAIERALSISAIRRDLETVKDNAAFIYHIINSYQNDSSQQIHAAALQAHVQQFQEAIQRSTNNTASLEHIVDVLKDLSAKEHAEKSTPKLEAHRSEYGSEEGSSFDREGGAHPPENKKQRRGRAAPPGRCHSCRRSETPEWRRGPDGARTLCNACGLHYAKLTRKLSKSAISQASIPGRMPPSASPMT